MAGKLRERRTIYRGYIIRYRDGRRAPWQLDLGTRDGHRTLRHFLTMAAARAHVDLLAVRVEEIGIKATTMSEAALRDAAEALTRLEGKVSLAEAADYYMRHEYPTGASVTVSTLIERYIESMRRQNCRPTAIAGFRWRAARFAESFGAESVHRVKRPMIEEWLDAGGWQGLNRRHYLATAKALLNFAVRERVIEASPAAVIESPTAEAAEPIIMPPADVRCLLHTAEAVAPQIVPALAISFFAGVRPTELGRLQWSDVRLGSAEPVITISAGAAKKRHRRNIDIQPNLAAWLGHYRKAEGNIMLTPSNHRRHLARVMAQCGITIPYNAGRHAFASYSLVTFGLDATVRWLGHSNSTLLLTTYKGTVGREASVQYWQIVPAEQERENIIRLAPTA